MAVIATLLDLFMELAVPWVVLLINILHIPKTVKSFITAGQYSRLFSPSDFTSAWFANFWATIGPSVKESYQPDVVALLQGRVSHGKVHDHVVNEPVSGVVLEVGAGNGSWMDVFTDIIGHSTAQNSPDSDSSATPDRGQHHRTATAVPHSDRLLGIDGRHNASKITKIFGVEPNPFLATALRRKITEHHLDDIYEVVPVGVEQLVCDAGWRDMVPEGSLDSIICICCLCSIPDPEKMIKALYRLLKPGGKWYIHEHVRATRGGLLMLAYQRISPFPVSFFLTSLNEHTDLNVLHADYFSFFYGSLMGGCRLYRPTLQSILSAGDFSEVALGQPEGEPSYKLFPRIVGVCTK